MPGKPYASLVDRLIANSAQNFDEIHCDGSACWDWTGQLNSKGYPLVSIYRRSKKRAHPVLVHRLVLAVFRGRKLKRRQVAKHGCDRRCCINPMHLEGGTQSSNMLDCIARGRHNSQKTLMAKIIELDTARRRRDHKTRDKEQAAAQEDLAQGAATG